MKKIIRGLCLSFLLLVFFSCASSRAQFSENKTIYGKVYDYENNPVVNARVLLNGLVYTESDAQGNFVFYNIKDVHNTIAVETALYQPFFSPFNIQGESLYVQIRLKEMNVYIEEAKKHTLDKNIAKAKETIIEAIDLNPQFQPAYIFLILLYLENEEYDELKCLLSKIKEVYNSFSFFNQYFPVLEILEI